MAEMKCGLCKQLIRGDERYVIDHYKCSADLHQSFRDDIALLSEALKLAERLVNDIRMCRDREELWQRVGMRDDLSYVHQQIARAHGGKLVAEG